MILVDTSVWIDHLRRRNDALFALLQREAVLTHPFVVGEIALGSLRRRETVLAELSSLPSVEVANTDEVARFIEDRRLFGRGIGYVDVHLLASVRLTANCSLATFDRKLQAVAGSIEVPTILLPRNAVH